MIIDLLYRCFELYRWILFIIFCYPYFYINDTQFFKKVEKIFEYMENKKRLWDELQKNPELYNELKKERCKIFYRRCNQNEYVDILVLLIEDKRYHIKDYYDYYLEVRHKNEIMKKIRRNTRLLNHISKYIKKNKKKIENEINMEYKRHSKEVKECMICYDEMKENKIKVVCKRCKTELDEECFQKWFKHNNTCVLCRNSYIDEEEYEKNIRNSIVKKYIEYKYFLECK